MNLNDRNILWGLGVLTLALGLVSGCSRKEAAAPVNGSILKLRQAVAAGDYEEGLSLAKDISTKIPQGSSAQEAFYLEAYLLAYGKSDFQEARLPLKHLLDSFPKGAYAQEAQRLLADCQYWQGHYETAQKEYAKLNSSQGEEGKFSAYSLLQEANCLLLDDKVGEAQEGYRQLVEKYPVDPLADSAQLMLANSYLKLQNAKAAKKELQKLVSFTQNKEIQKAGQKALRQIEEEEPFRGKVDVE